MAFEFECLFEESDEDGEGRRWMGETSGGRISALKVRDRSKRIDALKSGKAGVNGRGVGQGPLLWTRRARARKRWGSARESLRWKFLVGMADGPRANNLVGSAEWPQSPDLITEAAGGISPFIVMEQMPGQPRGNTHTHWNGRELDA